LDGGGTIERKLGGKIGIRRGDNISTPLPDLKRDATSNRGSNQQRKRRFNHSYSDSNEYRGSLFGKNAERIEKKRRRRREKSRGRLKEKGAFSLWETNYLRDVAIFILEGVWGVVSLLLNMVNCNERPEGGIPIKAENQEIFSQLRVLKQSTVTPTP